MTDDFFISWTEINVSPMEESFPGSPNQRQPNFSIHTSAWAICEDTDCTSRECTFLTRSEWPDYHFLKITLWKPLLSTKQDITNKSSGWSKTPQVWYLVPYYATCAGSWSFVPQRISTEHSSLESEKMADLGVSICPSWSLKGGLRRTGLLTEVNMILIYTTTIYFQ